MILELYALKITQPDSGGSYVGGSEDTWSRIDQVPELQSRLRELWTFPLLEFVG